MVIGLGLGMLTVLLAGGRLGNLARVRFRAVWAIFATCAVQLVIMEVLEKTVAHGILAVVHVLTYALAAVFVVANRKLLAMWVVALGAGLNALAIAANGGVMPATRHALEVAGRPIHAEFDNSTYVAHAKLAWLGDVFAVPKEVGVQILANVFSIGDILVVLGATVMLHWICQSRLVPRSLLARRPPPLTDAEPVRAAHPVAPVDSEKDERPATGPSDPSPTTPGR
jgi:hypothetical protein